MSRARKVTRSRSKVQRGRAGAEQLLAKWDEWSMLAVGYLDRRPNRTKTLTTSEIRRSLLPSRHLRINQANDVLFAWLLSGHIAVGADGLYLDARCLDVSDDEAFATAQFITVRAAEALMATLMGSHASDHELSKHLSRMLSWQIEAIPRKLFGWARFALHSDGSTRREQRAKEAQEYRIAVAASISMANRRDSLNEWLNATGAEHAAAILIDLAKILGWNVEKVMGLHRAVVQRLADVHQLGITPARLRAVVNDYWQGLFRMMASDDGENTRPRFRWLIAPLVSKSRLLDHLETIRLVAPRGVHDTDGRVGTCSDNHVPTFVKPHSAKNTANVPRLGQQAEASIYDTRSPNSGPLILSAQSLRRRVA